MVFSSLLFLFAFLPVTVLLYKLMPGTKSRNLVLFIVSLLFYGWGEPVYILVMLLSICEAFFLGLLIEKYRNISKKKSLFFMILSISLNLAALLFFKYCNFFIENLRLIPVLESLQTIEGLTLPIGISFYTFQIMSYTIDLYKGETSVQRNFISFGAYVTLFPQLIAGPIVRYRDVDDQLNSRTENWEKFGNGSRRFIAGLGKKILLGDAAAAAYEYFNAASQLSGTVLGAWGAVAFYTLHIYYDFSGYSDMAIGLGQMFGFDFLENFDHPYMSNSITEFWRRWHMSLGTWFREYVYIPLGGNRNGKLKQYRNIAVVWFLTGFWHGASWNFILWGVYYGALLMIEKAFLLKYLKKAPKIVSVLYSLFFVGIGWMLFSHTDLSECFGIIGQMFGAGVISFTTPVISYQMLVLIPFFTVAAVGATTLPRDLWGRLTGISRNEEQLSPLNKVANWMTVFGCAVVFVVCVAYLVDSTFSPFLYFIF